MGIPYVGLPLTQKLICVVMPHLQVHTYFMRQYQQTNRKSCFSYKKWCSFCPEKGEFITLDFPIEPAIQIETPHIIEKSFGVKPIYCGKNRMDIIVELENEETVKKLKPNLALLLDLNDVRGIIVTSKSKDYDFISRFFAPSIGVGEDPVTGVHIVV